MGIAPVFTLATDLVVRSAPPEQAGAAASLSETSSELGRALGIAILGSIGALMAFTQGMKTVSAICLAIAIVLATIPGFSPFKQRKVFWRQPVPSINSL